jgi:hypothetical protein
MVTPIWRNRLTNGIFSRRVIWVCPGVALRLSETRLDCVCGRPAFSASIAAAAEANTKPNTGAPFLNDNRNHAVASEA